ncbi:MAG: phenylalanine--tRNA ligase subunit beta [Alphaproteobacteria bacterium]|nr:phenylalanine--tRNA ligase subunit beta [Alphaproteobacteria bacterium]
MKFTLGWLKDHLETDAGIDRVAATLTSVGLEVESVVDRAKDLAAFTVGYVVSAVQHPNADRLRVCVVDTGKGHIQVVCGAPNARAGMKGVFAPSGTRIPGTGLELKSSKIRGVDSNGMLCSSREMGLSDEHEGIIDLPADAPVGAAFAKVLGLDDPVIEIKLTPNRGDCTGVRGIARDLAAAGLGRMKPLRIEPIQGRGAGPVPVEVEAISGCPYFVGRYVKGVKNGPAPAWMRDRLTAIGLRPISALVDMTNYVSVDLGRPLHVYDADKLRGTLRARKGRKGESFLALNSKTYEVDETMCAIADDRAVLGLGGIMGGEDTGCTAETVNVFIESAYFDPKITAATGRRLDLQSDARYRFERGVDPEFVEAGARIATQLIIAMCGGEAGTLVVAGGPPDWRRAFHLRGSRAATLGGLDIPVDRQAEILEALGFATSRGGDGLEVTPPSWRGDIIGEADLVEEVLRIGGFDAIPSLPLPPLTAVAKPAVSSGQRRVRIAKRALAARGLVETVNYSFVPRRDARLFGGGADDLVLVNPMSGDLDTMRPTPLPSLMAATVRNVGRDFADIALFEVAPAYAGRKPENQAMVAAVLRRGDANPAAWTGKSRPVDAFDAKADAFALLSALGVSEGAVQIAVGEAPAWYHPGRSGTLKMGPKTVLGHFGELHPTVLEHFDLAGPVVGSEIRLDALPPAKARSGRTKPALRIVDLHPVERDFAFVVDDGVAAEQVLRAARGADRVLIVDVRLFDLYVGPGVTEGKKSLAVRVRLQPTERSLTDAEIEAIGKKIVAAVAKATGASLRA